MLYRGRQEGERPQGKPRGSHRAGLSLMCPHTHCPPNPWVMFGQMWLWIPMGILLVQTGAKQKEVSYAEFYGGERGGLSFALWEVGTGGNGCFSIVFLIIWFGEDAPGANCPQPALGEGVLPGSTGPGADTTEVLSAPSLHVSQPWLGKILPQAGGWRPPEVPSQINYPPALSAGRRCSSKTTKHPQQQDGAAGCAPPHYSPKSTDSTAESPLPHLQGVCL